MSDVPDELLRDILSRLPVAPLLRFRCVSKSLKSLIDSQQFIKQQLNHSRKTDSNINIFLVKGHLFSADLGLLETNMSTFKELPYPLKNSSGRTDILGSCDGLLVLRNDLDDITILWNPSVKRFHLIPCPAIEIPCPGYVYGFGYDVVSDDYKFIRISKFNAKDGGFNPGVKVYSLKSDSWRTISDFPYHVDCVMVGEGVLANGALHFLLRSDVESNFNYFVVAFDLGTEEYRVVLLPKFARGDCAYLAVLGGCLGLLCKDCEEYVDMWVMKEYGVQESWSILFSYDICEDIYDQSVVPARIVAYSKCGRKVLQVFNDYSLIAWYDLDEKNFSVVPMDDMPSGAINDIAACSESLVLLNNGTSDYGLVTKQILEREISRLETEMEIHLQDVIRKKSEMELKISRLKTAMEMRIQDVIRPTESALVDGITAKVNQLISTWKTEKEMPIRMKISTKKRELEMLNQDAIRQNESQTQMDKRINDADMNDGQEESHEVSKKRPKKN